MKNDNNIWLSIEKAQKEYDELNPAEMKDYTRFYIYSIIAHSTAIEGSTLSERDAQLLFDCGTTKKGNIVEYLMNLDLKSAYEYAIAQAKEQAGVTAELLKNMNALVMKNTGGINNTITGCFDSTKGDYRLCGVTAGVGGRSYMNFRKVPEAVDMLCSEIAKRMNEAQSVYDKYMLSFDAHFNLVTIHPWLDGNGRTSRLLMNYMQFFYNLTPTKIHRNDKGEYIEALERSRDEESNDAIRTFMAKQHLKTLREEIDNYKKNNDRNAGFKLMF